MPQFPTILLVIPILLSLAQTTQTNQTASFSLIIRALRDSVKIGSPVTIEIIEKNISTHEINDSFIRGTLPYQIEVKDSRGSVMGEVEEFRRANELKAKESIRTFSVTFATLRPGESSRDR